MGEDGGLLDLLWKNKFAISTVFLVIAAIALAALAYHYYAESNDRAAQLSQKEADYDGLNATYYDLSSEHSSLKVSYANLTERYNNLSGLYDHLSSNESSIRADYESLNASTSRIREHGGPVIALYYKTHTVGTKDDAHIVLDTTVYNVGDRTADRITIKCKVMYEGQPNLNDVTFTNVASFDKRSYSWNFSTLADVDAVWVE